MASGVEFELWCIFSYYSLHGNPLDPENLKCQQLVKICRDCQLFVGTGLQPSDIAVLYTTEVKRFRAAEAAKLMKRGGDKGVRGVQRGGRRGGRGGGGGGRGARGGGGGDPGAARSAEKITYQEFLTLMMKLSTRVYPQAATLDDAFQQLLMENVLPLAKRRASEAITAVLETPGVQALFAEYEDSLEQLFTYYATLSERERRRTEGRFTRGATLGGRGMQRRTAGDPSELWLAYTQWSKFCTDYAVASQVLLSTIEIGDIYLSSVTAAGADGLRRLNFGDFWEALVRCALVAYADNSLATIPDKIRALFLYIWRAGRAATAASGASAQVNFHPKVEGAKAFMAQFTAAWKADDYRDYLNQTPTLVEPPRRDVLGQLMSNPVHVTLEQPPAPGGAAGGSAAAAAAAAPEASISPQQLSALLARRPSIAEMLKRNIAASSGGAGPGPAPAPAPPLAPAPAAAAPAAAAAQPPPPSGPPPSGAKSAPPPPPPPAAGKPKPPPPPQPAASKPKPPPPPQPAASKPKPPPPPPTTTAPSMPTLEEDDDDWTSD